MRQRVAAPRWLCSTAQVYLVSLASSHVPTLQVFKQATNFTLQEGLDLLQSSNGAM
uniref:Uncharacterized protein n=1 Tax=Oryza meridionalis TaxID=40149 RepID=A0A0E0F725_9ORYZ